MKIAKRSILQKELKVLIDSNAICKELFPIIKFRSVTKIDSERMKNERPDNIVYSEEQGYNARLLPYATNVGAPVIKVDDLVSWKSRGITNVNKEFESKFNELKIQYQNLIEEFEWNELVYGARFSFEPVVGEIYHLYQGEDGINFLSLISPNEWNKVHIGILINHSHTNITISQIRRQSATAFST